MTYSTAHIFPHIQPTSLSNELWNGAQG